MIEYTSSGSLSSENNFLRQGWVSQLGTSRMDKTTRLLKRGIWAYFLLLVFEGALRKWFLPGLAAPLLIVRDPIALWVIGIAWRHHRVSANLYLIWTCLIGILSLFTAVIVGHGNLFVALFGARILLIHFPLIFIIGQVFVLDDVVKLGKVTLWITIPMTLLIAMQFYSPQSAWVNRGLAGDTAGGGFSGALGYFRPPATFSFTSGTTQFYSFVASFIFYFWLNPQRVNRMLLIGATVGFLAAIPLSISRALLFQVGITVMFTLIAVARKPKYVVRMIVAGIGLIIVFTLLEKTSLFQTSTEVFTDRFETANDQEGGLNGVLIDRFLGGLISSINGSSDLPFWGFGLGMGTNVGSQLLAGERIFLISEGEWGRIVGELGPLFGLSIIFLRVSLTIKLTIASFEKLRLGNMLPWMLLSFGFLTLAQGGWAQPTSLGFSTMIGGLLLASLRVRNSE